VCKIHEKLYCEEEEEEEEEDDDDDDDDANFSE